jgi:hypothetical protein
MYHILISFALNEKLLESFVCYLIYNFTLFLYKIVSLMSCTIVPSSRDKMQLQRNMLIRSLMGPFLPLKIAGPLLAIFFTFYSV